MFKSFYLKILFLLVSLNSFGQKQWPAEVEDVLTKSRTNKTELEKVINFFNKPSDSLKLKAAYFLIANMDIHHSRNYYWADSLGTKLQFNELAYPDFASALKAFDSTKKTVSKIHPEPVTTNDIDSIQADFLIENINHAFAFWNDLSSQGLSFQDFCEYLLPYRISVEPLQNWRTVYEQKFKSTSKFGEFDSTLKYVKKDLTRWFTCTYNLEDRSDPIPRLGALQLLLRKKGPCEDVADLTVFTLRSQGIPASIDYVPAWATSSGNHTLNVAFKSSRNSVHYDILTNDSINDFIREPAKVLRSTYSKQKTTLPNFEIQKNIPEGFLRQTNYIDVTSEYWQTRSVSCKLIKTLTSPLVAYATVFNYGKWIPTWWGQVANDSVVFSNMCKGAVILPMYYIDGKLKPAGFPIASGYNDVRTLIPDSSNKITLILKEQRGYLRYRAKKHYRLFYWNKNWKLVGEKTANEKTTELVFSNVPANALYILVPEYSQRKERPFTFNYRGEREWW